MSLIVCVLAFLTCPTFYRGEGQGDNATLIVKNITEAFFVILHFLKKLHPVRRDYILSD